MARPVIITCAVTGGGDTVDMHPNIPVTPRQIAESAIEAAGAGAAIVHIHVRDPETGKGSMETALYREVVQRIRDSGIDVILNLTTGHGAMYVPSDDNPQIGAPQSALSQPERRMEHVLELKPEICSLDIATMNFGERVFMNTPEHLRRMARMIRDAGVRPELEVFDTGQIRLARKLLDDGDLDSPALFQLVLGVPWGAPASPQSMIHMRSLLPEDSMWAGFGISRMEFPMVAQAVILGGHVRVGLEDNLYLEKGVFASNAQLVERAGEIVVSIGENVAGPAEAREILGLSGAG